MKIYSFLSDLDINSKKDTNNIDASLAQGVRVMKNINEYIQQSTNNLTGLQCSSMTGVNSIIESMYNRLPNTDNNDRKDDNISINEDKLIKIFSDYNTAYKVFIESTLNANKPNSFLKQYLGKNVSNDDGMFSYINNYGYTQKYSNNAWKNRDSTCSSEPISIDNDLYKKINPGEDIGLGQPCGFAGKNIQNKTTREYAWVDIKGQKHVYSSDIWKRKIASCDTEAILLSSDKYDAIPTGSVMTTIDKCIQLEVDDIALNDLMKQNSELSNIYSKLISEIKKETIPDDKYDFDKKKDVKTLDSKYYIRMISWSILFLMILLITIDAISNEAASYWHMAGILISVCLLIIINFINVNSV